MAKSDLQDPLCMMFDIRRCAFSIGAWWCGMYCLSCGVESHLHWLLPDNPNENDISMPPYRDRIHCRSGAQVEDFTRYDEVSFGLCQFHDPVSQFGM